MMNTFVPIDDEAPAGQISEAKSRTIYIALGVAKPMAEQFGRALVSRQPIGYCEDACRMGCGDPEGLQVLHDLAERYEFPPRSHPGLWLGVLGSDDGVIVWAPTDEVIVWAPTPKAVEKHRMDDQPNGIVPKRWPKRSWPA